jgi:hypothetical protein
LKKSAGSFTSTPEFTDEASRSLSNSDTGLGKTTEPYFSLFDQITNRAGYSLDRHGPIEAMLIE